MRRTWEKGIRRLEFKLKNVLFASRRISFERFYVLV